MSTRIKINEVQPKAYQAMYGLERYLGETGINPTLKELIKIRVSQINGCAYCIDMHTRDARKQGETEQRIYALNAWRETPFFTETERAVLALAEEMTFIFKGGVSEEVYANAARLLGQEALAQVMMAIVTINSWNRIAISTQLIPGE